MREKINAPEAKIESLDEVRNALATMIGKEVFVKELIRKDKFNNYTATLLSVNKNIACVKPKDKPLQKSIILTDLLIGKVEIKENL